MSSWIGALSLEQEEKERREAALASVHEGQVIRGTVKTLMDFGAFIDIGGIDGLLHVTDMSWTRVNKPSDLLKPGDQVEVKVLKVNPENRKISLGMKQLAAGSLGRGGAKISRLATGFGARWLV